MRAVSGQLELHNNLKNYKIVEEEYKIWFNKLAKDREESAKMLEKPSMRGIKNSVVEKYSDQAHFIYELLQNANDANATESSFYLKEEGLYFKHNGTIRFSVSNPETEDIDKKNNELGHINSITSIANSNKTEASIGKFGVGFKAVFQYTETPHIYDPDFKFKIERFIIPKILDNDIEFRQQDETVFYFPFDKEEMPKERAYSDILEKLKKLIYPTLFLSNLQIVKWKTDANEIGEYSKKVIEKEQINNILFTQIEYFQQIGLENVKEKLIQFTRVTEHNHSYSIAYFLNENGKLKPRHLPAFCFFPTKETTNLNFIFHAPFLLTDSRERIHRSKEHNIQMVELLAQLSADSLLTLKVKKIIDDNIIKIIPYKKSDFYSIDWFSEKPNFFAPFYNLIKEKFETEKLLPTINGYIDKNNAFWPQDNPILDLFSDEQLNQLIDEKNAKWVFRKLVRNQTGKDDELREYIEDCIADWYEVKELFNQIDIDFIEKQDDEWLHKLYEYLLKNSSYWTNIKTKPIFKDSEGNAVAAFEKNGKELHEILFLPLDNTISSYKTIDAELLKNEKTKEFVINFGIKKPSLKDEIYNNILPLYEDDGEIDTETHFKKFFKYWKDEGRPEDFIELIKDKEFVSYKTQKAQDTYRGRASEIYYPSNDLLLYFENKPETKFVDLDDYYSFITEKNDRQLLRDFLHKVGVNVLPKIIEEKIKDSYTEQEKSYTIDSLQLFINNINNIEKSTILWNLLKRLPIKILSECEYSSRPDGRYNFKTRYYDSPDLKLLRNVKWLVTKEGNFVAPNQITINELSTVYSKDDIQAKELIELLNFKPVEILTEKERIANKFESVEEAEEALKALQEKREKEKRRKERKKLGDNTNIDTEDLENVIESLEDLSDSLTEPSNKKEKSNTLSDFNEDEELAEAIDIAKKKIELKKERQKLADSLNNSLKYSYDWFISYLQLLTTYTEKQDAQKQKTIYFQEITPYKKGNKYFLLRGASTYISPEIENADDFKVSFIYKNSKRQNIIVEGVSKKGQDLLIYTREPLPNDTIQKLSNIFRVEINFTPVIDLLDRLLKAFTNPINIDKWDNIQETLPPINFIYGPPGTGKTTTLCNKINSITKNKDNVNILILTPTNKAADVICKKLQEVNEYIYSVRLSRPTDPELEESDIYIDSLETESLHNINVVATTIHRLPYFEINGEKNGEQFSYNLFKHRNWDYVIFDEASMIGLHYITFSLMALSKTNSETKFIISGDPKQIPPVIEIDEKELENFDFQDENIYKMVNLESFNPAEQSIRAIDTIQNLDTQYRSIPQIGQLFSELSYSSLLKHNRIKEDAKQLPNMMNDIISSNVTFIDIPLNKENSIYKINKLFYSSYHIYSAILVSEMIKYFDSVNINQEWTIGLIAPYKAQAILLNKMITSYGISDKLKIYSDTVHGFQGDECDIVFFISNPNNYYFTGHEKSLLSKEYIYNVAISRAKDYLIILHPFNAINDNVFINKVGVSYKKNFNNLQITSSPDIEKTIFNERKFIENNSYVSGHDNVNVFGNSEMKYFIKASDTAIDIQLNNTNEKTVSGIKILGKIDLSKFEKKKKRKPNR